MDKLFELLIKERKSLIRMGDGEAYIMHYGSIGYEPYSPELRSDLFKTVYNYKQDSPYILSLPEMDINKTNHDLSEKDRLRCWLPVKILYSQSFPKNVKYGDAVTFYYGAFRPFFQDLIRGRKLIIVTNKENSDTLNKEYLSICHSFISIVTPNNHSYEARDEIRQKIRSSIIGDNISEYLLILACGPLSKVLAYEFSYQGIQSIDIGRGIELISFRSDGDLEFLL